MLILGWVLMIMGLVGMLHALIRYMLLPEGSHILYEVEWLARGVIASIITICGSFLL